MAAAFGAGGRRRLDVGLFLGRSWAFAEPFPGAGRMGRRGRRTLRVFETPAARRRLEGLGRAGAGLAHRLRTPLATIKGSCQLLLEDAGPAAARRLAAAVEQSERMERLTEYRARPRVTATATRAAADV